MVKPICWTGLDPKRSFFILTKIVYRDLGQRNEGATMSPDHTEPPAEPALRIKAIESLLIEKGIVDPSAIDEIIDIFKHKIGPRNGAKVVARAWSDPVYKTRLLTDATTAIAELGFSGAEGEDMMVLENTPTIS